ncbi:MAG: glycosyltransferase family 4 protein [Phocaeicola sp.]
MDKQERDTHPHKMRSILHVVNIYFVLPYFIGEQLNYFKERGYSTHIICSPSKELKPFCNKYDSHYKEVKIARAISIATDVIAILKTIRYIRKNKIKTVVGHTPKGGMVAMIAAFLAGAEKRIYFRHGLVYETSKGLKRKMLITIDRITACFATKVINVSPSVAKRAIEDKLNSPYKQLLLSKGTCNGIDTKKFSKHNLHAEKLQEIREQLALTEEDYIVGFSGRLVRDKGIIELVHAFKQVSKENITCKLLLIGMFEERDGLPLDVIEEIKNNPKIVTTDYVSYSEIEYYYGLMDLYILPSYREGFPTSVLEASAMELTVITTRVTGCIDSIQENETGFFIENEANSIATTLTKAIKSKEKCKEMGKKGRVFVLNNFSQEIIWKEILKQC